MSATVLPSSRLNRHGLQDSWRRLSSRTIFTTVRLPPVRSPGALTDREGQQLRTGTAPAAAVARRDSLGRLAQGRGARLAGGRKQAVAAEGPPAPAIHGSRCNGLTCHNSGGLARADRLGPGPIPGGSCGERSARGPPCRTMRRAAPSASCTHPGAVGGAPGCRRTWTPARKSRTSSTNRQTDR